jgi:hypothetical protein
MKEINKVGLTGIIIILVESIYFFTMEWNYKNVLSFLVITIGVGYLTSNLQDKIKKENGTTKQLNNGRINK